MRFRKSASVIAILSIGSVGGCNLSNTVFPEVRDDASGVSIDGLGRVVFPSPPTVEKGVEQPSVRWVGDTWSVSYGLIEKVEQESIGPMEFAMDCADLDETKGPQKVVFRSLASSRYEDGQEGRLYLEAWTDNRSDCLLLVNNAR